MRDRLAATEMGVKAVELLLEGKSNLIVGEMGGKVDSIDINFALITDRMYKNKLKDGDLDAFSPEQIEEMKRICKARADYVKELYEISHSVCK